MAQLRDVSNGAYALDLLQKQVAKLVQLQAPVAAGEGTEPLHQMRVAMRRLSTTLVQFEPALQVPAALNNQRLAKWVRRLGMARDLDVLRERLEDGLLPQLPEAEVRTLRPVLKRHIQITSGHTAQRIDRKRYSRQQRSKTVPPDRRGVRVPRSLHCPQVVGMSF